MAMLILQFLISAATIVVAGAKLTHFATEIAEHTKMGRYLAGLVLLAAATSIPELSVSINAARTGFEDVAVGNLLGSNLFNLMILGILDLSFRTKGRIFAYMSSAHALSAVMSILLFAIVGFAIVSGMDLKIGWVGFGSVLVVAAYLFGLRMVYFDQAMARKMTRKMAREPHESNSGRNSEDSKTSAEQRESSSEAPIDAVDASSPDPESGVLKRAIIGYAIAAGLILLAAPFLSESAGELANLTGLGATFVGTTFVAIVTSLPELVTTFAALRMGSMDIAVGNILGSNSFNMLLIAFVDITYPTSLLVAVSPTHAISCFACILVSAVAVMGQLYHVEKRVAFVEPDAFLIIGLVCASLGVVYLAG